MGGDSFYSQFKIVSTPKQERKWRRGQCGNCNNCSEDGESTIEGKSKNIDKEPKNIDEVDNR